MSIVLWILTFVLILVSLFLILIVLMQKSKDGGMGATLGGGMAEATFGAETGNVLSRSTIYASILFFVLAMALYLGRIYERKHASAVAGSALPTIAVPAAAPTSATPAPVAPVTVNTAPASGTAAATPAPAGTAPVTVPASATPAPAAPEKKP
jgi:preprotein translocase subunit SecG